MSNIKNLGLVGLVTLAVAAFVGAAPASAVSWQDNGTAITSSENMSITDNGSGWTMAHTGGLLGSRSVTATARPRGRSTAPPIRAAP